MQRTHLFSCIKTGCLIRINIYLSQSFYAIYLYCDDIISNNIVIVGTKNNVTTINSFSVSFVLTNTQPSFVKTKIKQITFTVATEFNSFCCSFLSCVLSFSCDMLLYVWSFFYGCLYLAALQCLSFLYLSLSLSLSHDCALSSLTAVYVSSPTVSFLVVWLILWFCFICLVPFSCRAVVQ